jgi:indoleamine 2,3-dioxygenase
MNSNLFILETFTSTDSERHFYLTSLLIELRGIGALRLMSHSLDEAFLGDRLALERIADYLGDLKQVIRDLTRTLEDVRTDCDPKTFYWSIRPFFNGGKWVYEGVGEDGEAEEREYGGPSAGQSSVIHALDVFLGIDHSPAPAPSSSTSSRSSTPTPSRPSSPSLSRRSSSMTLWPTSARLPTDEASRDATFMQRMQFYMPHHHRRFLSHLSDHRPSVRELALGSSSASSSVSKGGRGLEEARAGLRRAYDECVTSLKQLRDAHMRIAYLYIVSQSRAEPPAGCLFVDRNDPTSVPAAVDVQQKHQQQRRKSGGYADGTADGAAEGGDAEPLKGTGGTDLVKFLKGTRERTIKALIDRGS